MIILGIDPGLRRTGWGIVRRDGSRLIYVASGVVRAPEAGAMEARLRALHAGVEQVIIAHKPQSAALEETFVNVNGQSTLALGQARGAILLTLGLADLEVQSFAPSMVKKALVGNGRAEKSQVALMVQRLLPGCGAVEADEADALAVAVCGALRALNRVPV